MDLDATLNGGTLVMSNPEVFWADFFEGFRSNAKGFGMLNTYLDFYEDRERILRRGDSQYLQHHAPDIAMLETRLFSYLIGHTEMYNKVGRKLVVDSPEKVHDLSPARIKECEATDFQRFALFTSLNWKSFGKTVTEKPARSYTMVLWEIHSHNLVTSYFRRPLDFQNDFGIRKGFKIPVSATVEVKKN